MYRYARNLILFITPFFFFPGCTFGKQAIKEVEGLICAQQKQCPSAPVDQCTTNLDEELHAAVMARAASCAVNVAIDTCEAFRGNWSGFIGDAVNGTMTAVSYFDAGAYAQCKAELSAADACTTQWPAACLKAFGL